MIALSEGWAYLQAGLMWLAPQPAAVAGQPALDADGQRRRRQRPAPADWQPTALEAIAPTYIALNTPKGKLDGFRFRAGR